MALLEAEQITFTSYGVPVVLRVPARLSAGARALAPPGASFSSADSQASTITVDERDGRLHVLAGDQVVGSTEDEELALGMLDAQIRAQIAVLAPEHIFVHAGVVSVGGRALIMPGFTFAGKTTLTRALIEAGAVYYSDEFAPIDARGLVRPYPKPLSVRHRDGTGRTTETAAARLGGQTGSEAIPVGLVAVISYRPGATLSPEPLAAGAALLALLGHTIPARTRPQQAMATLKAAVQGATAWKSERGEAADAAKTIIESLS